MPTKSRKTKQAVPNGMSLKQMKRKKPLNEEYFSKDIEPLTESQSKMFEEWWNDKNLFAYGAAGTGKTFVVCILLCVMS